LEDLTEERSNAMKRNVINSDDVLDVYKRWKGAAEALDPEGEPVPRESAEMAERQREWKAAASRLWACYDELRSLEPRIERCMDISRVLRNAVGRLRSLLYDAQNLLTSRASERGTPEDHPWFALERNKVTELTQAIEAAEAGWEGDTPPQALRRAVLLPEGMDITEFRSKVENRAILEHLIGRRNRAIDKALPHLAGPPKVTKTKEDAA
jgi:hypothetical protein